MKEIAFFDFDGTITRKDSLFHFTRFAVGKTSFYFGVLILSPMLLSFMLGFIPNHRAKQKFISYFFKDHDYIRFQNIASEYARSEIDTIVRPEAAQKIEWHRSNGHKIVVVSASMESWLMDWCKRNELDLIATKLEILNGRLTGQFETRNCYGIEKVNRIKEQYELSDYNQIYAYGDSKGDTEMLNMANFRNEW